MWMLAAALVLAIASVTAAQQVTLTEETPCPQVIMRGTTPLPLAEIIANHVGDVDPAAIEEWLPLAVPGLVWDDDAGVFVVGRGPQDPTPVASESGYLFNLLSCSIRVEADGLTTTGTLNLTLDGLWPATLTVTPIGDRWLGLHLAPASEEAHYAGVNHTEAVVGFVQTSRGHQLRAVADTCLAAECACNDGRSGGCMGADDCFNGKTCRARPGTTCVKVAKMYCGSGGMFLPMLLGLGLIRRLA